MWKSRYITVKIQSVSNNTVSEMVQNNLLSEEKENQYPCGRVDILQSENTNNTLSEMVKNNLLPEGTKFPTHVEV